MADDPAGGNAFGLRCGVLPELSKPAAFALRVGCSPLRESSDASCHDIPPTRADGTSFMR